ncbi:MAG TPA: hypothetical protein VGP08_00140 [Pyrinomonadaceae bacterium]|jgi:hypothetical protein|nr:hypothetical protein [Pyrinomonadaceae bacterium]
MHKENLDYFIANQPELVNRYDGKVLVIKNSEVVGAYNTPLEAYQEALKRFELGTFSIQPCKPGVEAYTVTISTQEIFAD